MSAILSLVIPYFPSSRQDRVTGYGHAFDAQVMAMTKETNDTEKLIEVLEEELTYIRGECERWHTLYVEEAKARKSGLGK